MARLSEGESVRDTRRTAGFAFARTAHAIATRANRLARTDRIVLGVTYRARRSAPCPRSVVTTHKNALKQAPEFLFGYVGTPDEIESSDVFVAPRSTSTHAGSDLATDISRPRFCRCRDSCLAAAAVHVHRASPRAVTAARRPRGGPILPRRARVGRQRLHRAVGRARERGFGDGRDA